MELSSEDMALKAVTRRPKGMRRIQKEGLRVRFWMVRRLSGWLFKEEVGVGGVGGARGIKIVGRVDAQA